MLEMAPGSGNEIDSARSAYNISGDEAREATIRKEQARVDYEGALNEAIESGIVIDRIKTDDYGNPWVQFEISGDTFKSFVEDDKVEPLPDEGGIYSITIGPDGYAPLLGRPTQDVRIIVPPIEQAEKYREIEKQERKEDKKYGDDYRLDRALLCEPVVYFVIDRQLLKAPLSGLEWHTVETEREVAAAN